jgi:hypothetical protein
VFEDWGLVEWMKKALSPYLMALSGRESSEQNILYRLFFCASNDEASADVAMQVQYGLASATVLMQFIM